MKRMNCHDFPAQQRQLYVGNLNLKTNTSLKQCGCIKEFWSNTVLFISTVTFFKISAKLFKLVSYNRTQVLFLFLLHDAQGTVKFLSSHQEHVCWKTLSIFNVLQQLCGPSLPPRSKDRQDLFPHINQERAKGIILCLIKSLALKLVQF